jgi:hypothetical protein
VSELFARLREILAALSASDPSCKRFGAALHRYALLPPVDDAGMVLPDAAADYGEYVTRFSSGGVGPYYGLFAVQRAAAYMLETPHRALPGRVLPLAHLGCGYLAVMPLDGPAAGQIWLLATALDLAQPIRSSFTAFLLDWIDKLSTNDWLDGFVPIGQCALQAALTGYLHVHEQSLGLADGALAGAALRDALSDLGAGAIRIAAEGPLFDDGDIVDPCITCARMLANLAADGLRSDVVAPGVPAKPQRLV